MELVFDFLFTLSELDVFEDQIFILSIREVEELHLARKWDVSYSIVEHVLGDGKQWRIERCLMLNLFGRQSCIWGLNKTLVHVRTIEEVRISVVRVVVAEDDIVCHGSVHNLVEVAVKLPECCLRDAFEVGDSG